VGFLGWYKRLMKRKTATTCRGRLEIRREKINLTRKNTIREFGFVKERKQWLKD
jgi:hypothetical protein